MIEDSHIQAPIMRREVVLEITPDALLSLFSDGIFLEITNGFPRGSRVTGFDTDMIRNVIRLKVSNNEFEGNYGLDPLPRFTPTIKSYMGKELGVMRRLIQSVKDKASELTGGNT